MKSLINRIVASLLIVTVLAPITANANIDLSGQPSNKNPPQQAIDACKEKSEGAAVLIIAPWGEKIKATCRLYNGSLVAFPDNGFKGPEKSGLPKPDELSQ